ncbi:MAG TPA: glutamine-hydrolyzing carbamoyl-phosphate synthase small subunit [Phycisphaerae bacterium]|jgi:carbamoyl-phosphate synthase small subunit|nr:glutamine-hydrolyzing carbamoyl-phosphate synthase small subunit [Phycisphaerae bacterium]HOB74775.1 glutamine-hydrolyzing carbamoyl-phosphate synthase small subunit [Phycisphaerae bacterium]HOJ54390.1 glutamine-hydrolyzing carbamoyl-phosphate synthase small subunit [Phycisphaerae bacterium]HOL26861.1 glutamine-hydrolyzing carbamoyl-phosphate synthase small subunit [Phycisphaerae bacterium]HPP20022.1 glutamine-hydrolyzing carbamoyl-phosphate synthase small subunit [Phycisphaerae bacterium]
MPRRLCKLALEDGTVYTGEAFGADGTHEGEVCFNTSMAGYQEILTDPSYHGQIVTMTYPQIGNYGVSEEDIESIRPQVEGFVIKELAARASNFRASGTLAEYLSRNGVVGIQGVDTRAITRKLRTQGALRGAISTEVLDDHELVMRARRWPGLVGQDMVQFVAPREPFEWQEGFASPFAMQHRGGNCDLRVVAIDCGMKRNILRNLVETGCKITVVPPTSPAEAILEHKPAGVFVSNGPGDPEPVRYAVEALRKLKGQVPIFGICLGHQLLSLALGAKTYKLKFGHRGANQPVMNLATRRVEITSQNHGFAVDTPSLIQAGGVPTHENLNDGTLEGFSHPDLAIFSVQYHPEASPGPHDATYLFDCFVDMMRSGQAPTAEEMAAAQAKLEGKKVTTPSPR